MKKESKELKAIGLRIRKARQAKGLTVVKTAYLSGLDPSGFCKIQGGRSNARISSLMRIAETLGVEVKDLLGE